MEILLAIISGGGLKVLFFAALAIAVLYFYRKAKKLGAIEVRLKSEQASREAEQAMTDEILKPIEPGQTEDKMNNGKF